MKTTITQYLARAVVYILLFAGVSAYAQDPPQYGTPYTSVPDTRDITIYQVNIRAFSATSNFQGVINRLDNIKALGTNVLYLMPVFPVGTDSRSKIASSTSPYSIKDFTSVGSEYGTLDQLRQIVDGAHARGMAVILDWVVNQTSWDHPWITQHPDWYIRDGNGVIQQLGSFSDVAALNFSSTAMRTAMINAMRYWVFAANVDGFRCDYANNPPLDFWTQAISNLRGITSHKLIMLAEGDRLENFNVGFDLNFGDKFYYDALKPVRSGASVANIQNTTNTEYTYATGSQQVARYISNHDVFGNETPIEVFGSTAGAIANFVVAAYMRGVPFITGGQEVAFNTKIPWPWDGVDINWNINPDVTAEYTKIITLRNTSDAIRRGTMTNYSDANVCAFTKTSGTEKVVVLSNLRSATSNYTIPAALAGNWKDAYTGTAITLTSGATFSLTSNQYRVLTNANVAPIAVTSVSVSPATVSLSAGLTQQLTATVVPSNATNQNVSWSSSNSAIATVNASGLVTAIAAGSATITVTTQDGNKTATTSVTVTPSTSFTVNFYKPSSWGTGIRIYWWAAQPTGVLADGTWPGVLMTNAGNGWYSYTFTNVTSANLIFNDGTNQTADLTRNKNGWYLNNTWYDTNPGTPIAVTGVTVSPSSATVNVNATVQLTAAVAPANATNTTVTWSSGNPAVATVNASGIVTGIAGGTATITVTTQDGNKTASSTITVPSAGTTYYQIVNRWQSTSYLYDAGNGVVKYGTNPSGNSYQWARIDAGSGYYLLKNRATGNLMHVENQTGSVQCTTGDPTWWSAMWSISATGDGWNYIINRWQTSERIHIENLTGNAQYSGAQNGWYSAMWQLVNPVTARVESEEFVAEQEAQVQIYPNPVKGNRLYIAVPALSSNESVTITIQDINGRAALETQITHSGEVTHNLSSGLYFVRVRGGSVNLMKKILVE
ncbi:MAG TPA: Ig-like domain-containing protein [Ohtaekwangia sp.]|uniref:Ig-like domain-containing protein n=1 Tax=Ohtaekwangia sp. TaxID=2066019 RepID=UPI002F9306E8